jgi:type I restriction enzyme S subunit
MKRWPTKALGELCEVRIGRTPRRDQPRFWGGDNIWVTIGELDGGVITASKENISDAAVRECMPEPVPKDTLLFSFKLSIGKMAVSGCPLYTNEAIAALPIRNRNELSRDFLRYALMAESREGTADAAVLGKLLNKEKVQQLSIPIPPLSEQERIVKLLDEADELRKLRAQADRRTAEIIPALFNEMFGDPEFNPKGWRVASVGDVVHPIEFGISAPLSSGCEYQPGRIAVLRIANVTAAGTIDYRDLRYLKVSEAKRNQLMLKKGDILFNWRNSPNWVGKTAIFDFSEPCIFASFLFRLCVVEDAVERFFLWFYLNHLRQSGFFEAKCRQAVSQANFGREELAAVRIFLPPLPLQREFAARVNEIRGVESEQTASRLKLEALFKSMLHHAFNREL